MSPSGQPKREDSGNVTMFASAGISTVSDRGGFTPPFGELNPPLHLQTAPLPVFRLTSPPVFGSLS
jgi:hypothetical protein